MSNFKKITTGVLAGATLMVAASPAEAQYRYHRNRGDRTALAIGAGALGLAVGAAIASSNRGHYGNRGYYGSRGYYGRGSYDGYYGRPYAYGYGNQGYYGRHHGYGDGYRYGGTRCWRERIWDEWRGRWRRVRVCDRY